MVMLALASSMQPLTTTNEYESEFILPMKWQEEVRLRGTRSVVLFGSLISSRLWFSHLTSMLMGLVVTMAVTSS